MNLNKRFKTAIVVMAATIMLACGVATIISLIDTAIQVALQAAAQAGVLPPAYVTGISAGITALDCASTEMASVDTSVQKAEKVTACIAPVIAQLTSITGISPSLQALVSSLITDLQNVLNNLPTAAQIQAAKADPQNRNLKSLDVSAGQRAHLLSQSARLKLALKNLQSRK